MGLGLTLPGPARRNRQCRLAQEGRECSQGLRLRHHYVLCGALLRVWGRVAAVMAEVTGSNHLQIVRLKTKDQKKQVGEWGAGPAPGGGPTGRGPSALTLARRHQGA